MANRLLKNIAVTIGAGLAIGIGRTLVSRGSRSPGLEPPAAPNLSPVLSRLDDIENRVSRFELTPSPIAVPAPEEIQALGTLVSSQSEDIAALRQDIERIERRNAEQIEAFGQKVALLEHQVPAHIESNVAARMTELEHRLRGEFQDIHHRTVDAFAETIEKRVINRINAIENSLIEQSHSIVTLREKSFHTDDNLQRLLGAVEKLCARAEAQSQIPLLQGRPSEVPFAPAADTQPEAEPIPEPAPATPVVPQPGAVAEPIPDVVPELEAEPDPELEYAAAIHASPPPNENSVRRGFKPVGMAILGIAILGFRLIR